MRVMLMLCSQSPEDAEVMSFSVGHKAALQLSLSLVSCYMAAFGSKYGRGRTRRAQRAAQ